MRSSRREDGATTAEYLTVLALVTLLVGMLGAAGLLGPLQRSVEAAFCLVEAALTDGCVPGDPIASGDVEAPICTLGTEGEGVGGSVTIASVQLGADGSYDIVRTGDGTGEEQYRVDLDLSGSLGLELMTGGRVDFAEGVSSGRYGELSASGELTYAPSYTFDTLEQAEAFAEETRRLVTGPADDLWDWRTFVPVWGQARIPWNQWERVQDYDPPPPSQTRLEGSVHVEASGGFYGGGAEAEGEASIGRSVGAIIDHDTGATTIYYQVDGALAAQLGVSAGGIGGGAQGSVSSELVLGVTFDADNDPSALQVGWTGQVSGGAQLPLEALWFADGATSGNVADAFTVELDVDESQTRTLEATATLDLTDPRLATAGNGVVDALLAGDVDAFLSAGRGVLDHVKDESDLLVQYHHGDLSEVGIDVGGGHVLAFGFGARYESGSQELADAWYRPGGHGAWIDAVCGTT